MRRRERPTGRVSIENLCVFLIACAVCLLFLELLVGAFYPQKLTEAFLPDSQKLDFFAYDPILGWVLKPNSSSVFYAEEFETNISISPQGLRDRVYPVARSNKARIAFVGDSFAWGAGVEENETIPKILETELGGGIEVLNFGVYGYGTDQELLYLDRVLEFEPDLVILQIFSNDFADIWPNARHQNKPFYRIAANGSLLLRNVPVPRLEKSQPSAILEVGGGIARFLSLHSHLWAMSKKAVKNAYFYLNSGNGGYWFSELSVKNSPKLAAKLALEKRLVAEFQAKLKLNKTKMLLVYLPLKEYASQAAFEEALNFYGLDFEKYDRNFLGGQLSELAKENEIPFVDLGDEFENRTSEYYFKYDAHTTYAGNKVAARAIAAKVKPLLNWTLAN